MASIRKRLRIWPGLGPRLGLGTRLGLRRDKNRAKAMARVMDSIRERLGLWPGLGTKLRLGPGLS